jgi:hypothetical protein
MKKEKNSPRYLLWSKAEDAYATKECAPKEQLNCARCYSQFKPIKHYQIYCSDSCEKVVEGKMHEIKERNLNGICEDCGLSFRNPRESSHRKYCYACLKQRQRARYVPKPESEKKKFIPKNRISYDELIRRSEHERVWKDSGWTHYIKGRKWDRI